MDSVKGEFSISETQQHDFARLSGDFNPIHVDPVYARRLPFGAVVIHGVHSLLRAMDEVCSRVLSDESRCLSELSALFAGSIQVAEPLHFRADVLEDERFKIIVSRGGKRALTIRFRLRAPACPADEDLVVDGVPPEESPELLRFPPENVSGVLPLFADRELALRLFPSVGRALSRVQLAQILASTRIVGMRCPGLNSLFVGLRLVFESPSGRASDGSMSYASAMVDERYRRLKMSVGGQGLEGELDTFFRVGPVEQPSFVEVRRAVASNEFQTQRALVVGGTRGLGEVTAKLLAAGGADVLLTYRSGAKDAERIRGEIAGHGARCRIAPFDVTAASRDANRIVDEGWLPTHLYFFASPRIARNDSAAWNDELFETYNAFYVRGFCTTVENLAAASAHAGKQLVVVYPSSVYVDSPEKGFAEYAAAKSAGEAACAQLGARFDHVRLASPRLPRMRTDQTSGLLSGDVEEPLGVMASTLRSLPA